MERIGEEIITSALVETTQDHDIIRYGNSFNDYNISLFSVCDQNIFFCLVGLFFDIGDSDDNGWREIGIGQLMDKVHYSKHSALTFQHRVRSVLTKILTPVVNLESADHLMGFVCFDEYDFNRKDQSLRIHINSRFRELLHEKYFTRFEFQEFICIGTAYAKNLYRLLKQYRTKGKMIISVEEFRKKLNIPDTYRQREIDTRVFRVALGELSKELDMIDDATGNKRIAFRDLRVIKIKLQARGARGRGGKVVAYKFEWNPARDLAEIADYKQAKAEQPQQQLITKKRKKLQDEHGNPVAEQSQLQLQQVIDVDAVETAPVDQQPTQAEIEKWQQLDHTALCVLAIEHNHEPAKLKVIKELLNKNRK